MTETTELSDHKLKLSEKFVFGQLKIPRRLPDEAIPLSYEQEQIWLHAQLAPNLPLYNEPVTVHYSGPLDVAALEKSFNEILRRHEAWRICFEMVDGIPVQRVQSFEVSLPVLDLRNLSAERREAEAVRIATEDVREPIDLTKVPLFKTKLIRLKNEEYRLYLTLSHLIFDGVAIYRVLLPELSTLYESFAAGRQSKLPELSIQYSDYACWQRRSTTEQSLTKDLNYWKGELAGSLPQSYLPADRTPVGPRTFHGSTYPFVLNRDLNSTLTTFSRSHGVTLFQVLLAGFAALLCRYSGEQTIPIGSLTVGRKSPETQALLGYFVNTVVLRLNLSGDPSFRELVKRVRNVALGALEHDNLPFEHLVKELRVKRDSGRNPLFQALFSLAPPLPELNPAWQVTQMDVDTGTSKYDLHFELDQRKDEILPRFHYSTDLFDRTTIERMAIHWMNLLEAAAGNPDLRVSQLPLLCEREKHQLLAKWNDTDADYPRDKTIPQLFAAQCDRTPDVTALRHGDQQITFRQLHEHSDKLARCLHSCGARPGTNIALCVDRSIDMVAGLLAILKTGAAYVPLDPSYPAQRLKFILQDSEAAIVVTQQKYAENLSEHSATQVWLDADWNDMRSDLTDSPGPAQFATDQPNETAYVLYTSGSTGTPKGVQGTHRACLNRFAWMWRAYPFQPGEICCQKTNLGFVDSVWEIFGPLLAGVPSVIISQQTMRDPEELLTRLATEKVTRIVLVPSLLRVLLDHAPRLGERVPQLKMWSCSGEVLPTYLVERFRAGFPAATLLNIYGSSEVAADVTCHEVSDEDLRADSIPIGRPIANMQAYILDGNMHPVPQGVRGEIYVGGDNLALGYWRRADLTAERFVVNPIAPERSPRLYRTGDLGRFKSAGEIEYLGRVDNQVKIRGMRLELGEIEAVLAGHPHVSEAVVIAAGDEKQQKLCAYLVMAAGEAVPDAGEMRRYLRSKLPDHMVPASYLKVESFPLLPSGKVDRRAIPALPAIVLSDEAGLVSPRNETEEKLAEIWKELLQVKQVGIEQDFFELGGHSLLALQVTARVRREFEVELPLRTLFEGPTVAALALELKNAQAAGLKARSPIIRRGKKEVPAAFAQQRLWFLDQFEPESAAYNLPRVFRICGPLSVSGLTRALNAVVQRHGSLRTVFDSIEGEARQVVLSEVEINVPVIDLSTVPEKERQSEALRLASEEGKKPFNLSAGPLVRATLVRLGRENWILVLVMHHIIADGWSISHLFRDVTRYYAAFSENTNPGLPDLPIEYTDYSEWQREYLSGEVLSSEIEYWKKTLAGAQTLLELPTDHPRPAAQTWNGCRQEIMLEQSTVTQLKAMAQQERATLFMLLMAVFQALLWRYTRQESILVGTPVAGRDRVEVDNMIGLFVNTLVFRTDFTDKMSFRDLLRQVRSFALDAYTHQDLPFEKLVEELVSQRSLATSPLFQVMFIFQNTPKQVFEIPGLSIEETTFESGIAKFDLSAQIWEDSGFHCQFEYNTDLFEHATIQRILGHYERLIQSVLEKPDLPVAELPLMNADEREQMVVRWNRTATEYSRVHFQPCIHELFEHQAELRPEAVAVVAENSKFSYREVNKRANQLARYLRNRGVGPEVKVGLSVDRGVEMVIALLGILKAGGAYVPLDPRIPDDRLRFMLADAETQLVVTERKLQRSIFGADAVLLDTDWNVIAQETTENLNLKLSPETLAYVMYTSGSTGKPKGVPIEHGSVVNLLRSMQSEPGLDRDDVLLAVTTLSFDIAGLEMYLPLITGARLVVASSDDVIDGDRLRKLLTEHSITFMQATPATWRLLLGAGWQGTPKLKILCGGEALPPDLAKELRAGAASVWNVYGPTETTIWSAVYRVGGQEVNTIPIGRPIANTSIYIFDSHLQPVPVNVKGEIYIGGDGLARGYLNRSQLTAERFVANPVVANQNSRLYRTGDLGRFRSNGDIEYLGRVDSQVKLRGMRLELGEIEALLSGHPEVRDAVVVLTPDQQHLAAYITVENSQPPSAEELRRYLRVRLPEHMVPASYRRLDSWPLLPSGKIDRHALPPLTEAESVPQSAFVGPRDTVEKQLLTIWKGILNRDAISVTDDFFSIGGHSLASARLLARIQQTFGKKLTLRNVFEAPTIAEMAEVIGKGGESTDKHGLLPLQPKGFLPPFFWVRGGPLFLALSRRLGPERPSFGLQFPSSLITNLTDCYKFEDIASSFIQAMRAVRPHGPYYLGGLCVNGVLAYEMARQLVAAGESVPLVVMLDSQNPTHYFDYSADGRRSFLYHKVRYHLHKLATLRRSEFRQYIDERRADLQRRRDQRLWNNTYRRGRPLENEFDEMGVVHPASLRYEPQPYEGRVMFFQSSDWPKGQYWSYHRGWTHLADGGVEVHTIEGGHETMLHEPIVEAISTPLLSYLGETNANDSQLNAEGVLVERI